MRLVNFGTGKAHERQKDVAIHSQRSTVDIATYHVVRAVESTSDYARNFGRLST